MNRRIFIVLILIAIIGSAALYFIQQGPSILIKSPQSELIAFVSDRSGHNDIWTMNTDGTDTMQLTNDTADNRLPVWSPDGKEILSLSDKAENTYQIFESAWNGKYIHRITTSTGAKDMPVWNNDGSEIAFISAAKVFIMEKKGGQEEQFLPPHDTPDLAAMSGEISSYTYAAWSNDNKEMLYIKETDTGKQASIIEYEGAGHEGSHSKPVDLVSARNMDAAWSPTTKQVVTAFIDSSSHNGLVIFDAETLDTKNLLLTDGDTEGTVRPVWSPDGKKIAYELWTVVDGMPERCKGIYIINASGGKPERLIAGDAQQPCWSTDGTKLIYTLANEDGKRDIWKINADGTNAVNLTNGQGDNRDPSWSPAVSKK
ncbi:MAG: hypothetical protein ACYC27_01735 [Armatimonadota bacterium]